jgi:hypothetical protein
MCTSGLLGNQFSSAELGFSIKAPDSWTANPNKKGKAIAFNRNDDLTEASVEVMNLEAGQKDSVDVAKSQIIAYDGWQFVAGRPLEWNEKHGADNGFSSMYQKVMLRGMSTNNKIIVQEGYFVKGRKIYIVTLVTDASRWPDAKGDLLSIWDSFSIK